MVEFLRNDLSMAQWLCSEQGAASLKLEAAQGQELNTDLGFAGRDGQPPERCEARGAIEGQTVDFVNEVKTAGDCESGDRQAKESKPEHYGSS